MEWPTHWEAIMYLSKGACSHQHCSSYLGPCMDRSPGVLSCGQHGSGDDPAEGICKDLLTHFLSCLFFYAAFYRFSLVAIHISGNLNVAADTLSHYHLHVFSCLCTQVPLAVRALLVHWMPDWGLQEWTTLFSHSLIRHRHPNSCHI